MEMKDIYYDQFREVTDGKARLRRVQRVDRVKKVRDIKDSEKDKEERKNKNQELSTPVVIQAKEKNSSATIELSQKASKIADRYAAQQHMMGQNIGGIDKLRKKLNNMTEKEAIETVAEQQSLKIKKAKETYKNGQNTTNRTEETER
ncbi:MAG: hypothetical protein HFJ57_04660 [Clostridia bacterium]|nr:hypothetical protein [Clostridia bacterium]